MTGPGTGAGSPPSGRFDPGPGALVTDAGETIAPGLTRTAFRASSLADGARDLVVNEPWHSWLIDRAIAGRPFRLGLYFHGEALAMVLFALREATDGGPTWDEWTLEQELARKAAHTAWLASFDASMGEDRTHPWGRVASIYDQKSGGAEIVLRYGPSLP